jgi:hypothetical protein
MVTFTLDDHDIADIKKWDQSHKCKFRNQNGTWKYGGAIGGRLTYYFTPTSIGDVCEVKCACGKKHYIDNM